MAKYKLKTYKAAAKRFRMTKNGKILRVQGGKSHLRRRKSQRVKFLLRQNLEVTAPGAKRRIKRLVPYMRQYKANPPR
ncbi:MAG: 50S ribosomal protein L35 [Chloroflexi bacterium]|nr:50S ribosomal protein L35 [Chloroflexota bacterium]MCI0644812.1 50S ribosomal protein L35 [Chloroflexota bacterium]MCI0731987.1 50S ribosomal protein L35 [Chloroflexota bacterium]